MELSVWLVAFRFGLESVLFDRWRASPVVVTCVLYAVDELPF